MCGKELDEMDENADGNVLYYCGYGSAYDGYKIKCRLCCACIDRCITTLLALFKENPLEEYVECEGTLIIVKE